MHARKPTVSPKAWQLTECSAVFTFFGSHVSCGGVGVDEGDDAIMWWYRSCETTTINDGWNKVECKCASENDFPLVVGIRRAAPQRVFGRRRVVRQGDPRALRGQPPCDNGRDRRPASGRLKNLRWYDLPFGCDSIYTRRTQNIASHKPQKCPVRATISLNKKRSAPRVFIYCACSSMCIANKESRCPDRKKTS